MGAGSGAAKGAAVGTVLFPGLGTTFGAAGGAVMGGLFGSPEDIGGTSLAQVKWQHDNGVGGLRGTGYQAQRAYDTFLQMVGRDPTEAEFAQLVPSFKGEGGDENGAAAVGAYAQTLKQQEEAQKLNDPTYIAQQQQAFLQAQIPKYTGTAAQLVFNTLGRGATDQEVQHFAGLMAQGYDAYQIQQALQQTTEYQQKADAAARKELGSQLGDIGNTYLKQKVAPALQSYFAQRGRATSPALDQALAAQASQVNTDMQKYLVGIGAEQYNANKAGATAGYQQVLDNYYKNLDYNTARSAQLQDMATNRQYGLQDYNMQKAAYDQYLANYGKRDWLDYLNTSLQGVNALANVGRTASMAGML